MNWIAIADIALTVIDRATEEVKKKGRSAEGESPTFVDTSTMLATAIVLWLLSLLSQAGFVKKSKKKKESSETFESIPTEEITNQSTTAQAFMPVEGDVIVTERFGVAPTSYRKHTHKGIDIRANKSKLYATEDGVVAAVGNDKSSGIYVSIEYPHDDGTTWRLSYCHLSEPLVKVGDKVKAGQVIGISGNTGNSTAPHLHLTVKKKKAGADKYDLVDPMEYLNYIKSKGATGGVSDKQGNVLIEKTPITTHNSELTQTEETLQISSYSPPTLKKNANAQGVARKTKNPGNMTGSSPFGTGELYTHPRTGLKFTIFESFTKGYAGNAWRLLQYLGGKTRYLSKNPTLRQLVRTWVGTDDTDELMKRARDAGISNVDAKLPITFNVVLAILLALGKYDSGYCVPDEARQGLLLAWAKWIREGNDVDEGGSSENILVNSSSSSTFINNETNRRQ